MEYVGFSCKNRIYFQSIENGDVKTVSSIKALLLTIPADRNTIYYHGLRTDGKQFYKELLENGYKSIKLKKQKKDKSIYIKENSTGQIYEVCIYETKTKHIKLKNINVLINTKLSGNPYEDTHRLKNTIISLKNIGCVNSSISSYSFTDFVRSIGGEYRYLYPVIKSKTLEALRMAYNHGIYYLNNKYQNKEIKEAGISIDVNSMYPYILLNYPLPYGKPIEYKGEYKTDRFHPYYIQEFYCILKEKKNCIHFLDDTLLDGLPIKRLICSNIEIENIKNNYNIEIVKYVRGWKFATVSHVFDDFVNKWFDVKTKAKEEGDYIKVKFSKNVLNMIIGQFGRKDKTVCRYPTLENGEISYRYISKKCWSVYVPLSIFIVDIGRKIILENAQKIKDYSIENYNKDMYIYSDTDSIFTILPLEDIKKIIEIDDYKIGAFKVEKEWQKAVFLGIKAYCLKNKGQKIAYVSGLQKVNYDKWIEKHNIKI